MKPSHLYTMHQKYDDANLNRLRKLISNWAVTVAEICRGYDFGLDAYLNDISVRDDIESLSRTLGEIPQELAARLLDTDERLKSVLTPVLKPIVPESSQTCYWYTGLPGNAHHELLDDAKSFGLL